ncbi:MAG TPA: hypothetical protein VGQ37_01910 [Vicinamibacterales bacterium]|nr:hypothetical protein [Vicinamibacterales bacterium]
MSVDELEDLKSSNSTIPLALFGISFGALVSISTTLATVSLTDTMRITFIASAVVLTLASIFFGATALRAEVQWRKRIERFRKVSS